MILTKFIQLIKKNFKLLIRSKASALVVIFGPLLVILLLGLAFDNTNTYALNVGIYSSSYNNIISPFVEKLSEKQFNVVKTNTQEECIQKIKEGALHTCVIFPADFSISGDERKNEITFYVDYSRINMVYLILETLTNKISLHSKEISMELTNTLLTSLEETRKEVFVNKPLISKLFTVNEKLSGSVKSVTTDLGSLDLNVNVEDFQIAEIKTKVSESDLSATSSTIDNVKSKISTARSIASSLEGGSEVVSHLSSAYSYLSSVEDQVDQDINITDETLVLIENAYNQIILTRDKLALAATARDGVNSELTSLSIDIEDSINWINNLKDSFEKIDNYVGSVQVSGADEVVSPIKTNIKAVTSETTHLNLLFPSLIILVIMFVSILLGTTLVMMEKHSPAYFRNFISPASDFLFVISTYFTNMVIVFIQIIIIIGISIAFFSADLLSSVLEASVSLVLITTAFTFIGLFIGYLFNSEEIGTLAAISAGSLFLLLSNIIIPLESVPEALREVLAYNPFVVSESLLRQTIIYQQSLDMVQSQIAYLLILSLLLFAVIMLINLVGRKNLLKGSGGFIPGKINFSFLSFFKKKKKSKIEKIEEKEDKAKQKKFSFTKLEASKSNNESNGFFSYLKRK